VNEKTYFITYIYIENRLLLIRTAHYDTCSLIVYFITSHLRYPEYWSYPDASNGSVPPDLSRLKSTSITQLYHKWRNQYTKWYNIQLRLWKRTGLFIPTSSVGSPYYELKIIREYISQVPSVYSPPSPQVELYLFTNEIMFKSFEPSTRIGFTYSTNNNTINQWD